MSGLKGRVACVTGVAQGIGREICARLVEEGAHVAVMDNRDTAITVERCTRFGVDAQGFLLDVRDKIQIHAVVQEITHRLGRIDIWVDNAGIFDNTATVDVSEELWDLVSDINYKSICLRPNETEMLKNTYQQLADINGVTLEEWCYSILKTIPVARFGKPADVAALIAFLASEEAGFINGQAININGGLVFY